MQVPHNRGKKKIEYTEIELQRVEAMAGLGLPLEKMAVILGRSKESFISDAKKNDTLRRTIESGQSKSSTNLRQTAYDQAMGYTYTDPVTKKQVRVPGNPSMTMFLLKTREGFREVDRLELTGADGKPLEVTTLTHEQRQKRLAQTKKLLDDTDDE